jgi:cysteine desulfuration protein SufE
MLSIEGLISDFDVLDEWEDRYRHIIELGKALPAFDDRYRDEAHKVRGCASQVWIHVDRSKLPILHFTGDSDALIVKGLVAIVFAMFSGKTAEEISKTDAGAVFAKLGLKDHLTQQRSNGLASMVARIKSEAARAQAPA